MRSTADNALFQIATTGEAETIHLTSCGDGGETSSEDERDRELAELKAQVERLTAAKNAVPPKVEVTGGPSSGGGFKGGFFGCFGVIAALVVLVIVLVALSQCAKNAATTPAGAAAGGSSAAAAPASWIYTESPDTMRKGVTKTACLASSNEVKLEFLYHNQHTRLCVRKAAASGLDVFVALDDSGQFLCSSFQDCTVSVTFDGGPVQRSPAIGPSDSSTGTLFIRHESKFVAAAKKAKAITVEAEFFQAGNQQMEFTGDQLKWS